LQIIHATKTGQAYDVGVDAGPHQKYGDGDEQDKLIPGVVVTKKSLCQRFSLQAGFPSRYLNRKRMEGQGQNMTLGSTIG
jgi:hypothetical protein